ncbi:MAG: MBL fold metallo-hydrolase [Tetrasphaera sp.]
MNTPTPQPPVPQLWASGPASARAHCLLAPNPGPMTLDGTNTWVLLEPGSTEAVVIDPGPDDVGHLTAIVEHVAERGARVSTIVLTHAHLDHSEGAPVLAERTGARVRAVGPGHDDLGHGDVVRAGALEVRIEATPGHTADSVSLVLAADRALLTGDTVLGRGTTVVAHPDGELAAYLESLDRIRDLIGGGDVVRIYPGHGPLIEDASGMVAYYRVHRRERLDQVRAALSAGANDVESVLRQVYADVPESVWPAARMSIAAQLLYLRERGEFTERGA